MSTRSGTRGDAAANYALIKRFYDAFGRRDVDAMLGCYHPQVVFSDPVFGTLAAAETRAMWRMLSGRARDLRVQFRDVEAGERSGRAHWEAWYTFAATGRAVHNRIDAEFQFADALIVRHVDRFSLWRWAAMALGAKGAMLGWVPSVRGAIRAQAAKGLAAYRASAP
ncbi:MAG: nuclear transport factor 2 family protein [Pseudomonadota bacterium]|nr:nuclear transport factor 2 family protein [Pseudomonadota bacterium]